MAPSRSRTELGFTLTELMIVVAIAGITVALALPSFNDALVRNRLASQTNDFIAAVSMARTASLGANAGGGICAANDDQTACGGSWDNGWIVWVDINRNANVDADEILSVGQISEKDQLVGANAIEFDGRGRRSVPAMAAGNPVMVLRPVDCSSGKPFLRTLTVSPAGSVLSTKGDC